MKSAMRIVYLDQNKWIQLARAAKHPDKYPDLHALLKSISHEVGVGHLALPLTFTNIYETFKINNPQRRHDLASVQAALSRGLVFRGRYKRLEEEVSEVSRDAYGLPPVDRDENWFLSDFFLEAFAKADDDRLGFSISNNAMGAIRKDPAYALFNYLVAIPDEQRLSAVKKFSEGSEQLRRRVENRRSRHRNQPLSMRRKIYSALLMIDEMELVLRITKKAGLPWTTIREMGDVTARRIIRDVPTYYIERELALRLETQDRPIEENDFRDMQSFCTVLQYSDEVIAENQFVNLAKQAGLNRKYDTRVTTDILGLGKGCN
jgi:hypothetical protein